MKKKILIGLAAVVAVVALSAANGGWSWGDDPGKAPTSIESQFDGAD